MKARIKAIMRRATSAPMVTEEKANIRVRDLEVNPTKRTVTLGGKEVKNPDKADPTLWEPIWFE